MTKTFSTLTAVGVAAVVVLTGCGSQPEGGSSGNEAQATPSSAGGENAAAHNDADIAFAQMMIPHHEQAVEMSDIMLAKDGLEPDISELATQIKDAQAPEIETMTRWLEAWGAPVESGHSMEGHDMDPGGEMEGMLSEDQLAELEAAEGEEAADLFLESMIEHHEGAVDMAEDEINDGENPDAIALAETIVETQQAEIDQMRGLLNQ